MKFGRKIKQFIEPLLEKFSPYKLELRTLKRGYRDPREVILHSVMQSVVDLRQDPWYEMIDWHHSPEHEKVYFTVERAYNYWTQRRPARWNPLYDREDIPEISLSEINNDTPEREEFRQWGAIQEIYDKMYDEEDQQMLKDVIDVRLGLWC